MYYSFYLATRGIYVRCITKTTLAQYELRAKLLIYLAELLGSHRTIRWQRRGRRAPPRPPARLAGVSGTARVLTVRGRAVGRGPGRLRTLHWAPLPLLPRVQAWCDEDEYCLVLQERCTRWP